MSNPYASTDPAVIAFIAAQNSGPDGRGGSLQFAPALLNNGVAGTSSDNVIGFSAITAGQSAIALGSGFNTVILDGQHSINPAPGGSPDNVYISVDTAGTVTVTDSNSGNSVVASGVSYLIFEGAAAGTDANGNPDYASMYFIGGANQTEVTELYYAAFGRQPDLGGVEYYMNQLKAGFSFLQIAGEFMASPEFQTRFGADVSDTQFITNLYQNVLHRVPVASELGYYQAALSNEEAGAIVNNSNPVMWSRAQELLNFTNSPEDQADVAGFVISTAWTSTNGAVFADTPPASQTASQVLMTAESTGVLNTNLINPASITAQVTVGENTINPAGAGNFTKGAYVGSAETSGTIDLSPVINAFGADSNTPLTLIVNGASSGSSLVAMTSGTVNFYGTGNIILAENNGTLPTTLAVTVNGFVAGDKIEMLGLMGFNAPMAFLTPTAPIAGSSLVGQNTLFAIDVGNVGSGSGAEVAAAAQKLYSPADVLSERALFYGQITTGSAAGGTAIYDWGTVLPGPTGADVHGTHMVNATDFCGGVILTGIAPSALTTAMFYH